MSRQATPDPGHSGTDVTVPMTGAGTPGASGIVRSLRASKDHDVRVVGVDKNPSASGFALVDDHDTVPAGGDDDYVPRSRELVEAEDVDAQCGPEMVRYWQEGFRAPDEYTFHVDGAGQGPSARLQ